MLPSTTTRYQVHWGAPKYLDVVLGLSVTGPRDDGVMGSHSTHAASPARRSIVLSPELRQHRCDVARAALGAGRPLNLDAITVILATKGLESTDSGTPFTRWTSRQVVAYLWGTVLEWCHTSGIEPPENLGESLWTYLTYLFEEGELASGSSTLTQLREALVENAALTNSGRSRSPRRPRAGAEVRRLR